MKISDLQRKDIININDGTIVGRIVDVIINENNGIINDIIIEKNKHMKSLFTAEKEIKVKYEQIKKIGEDVILIDCN